MKKKMFVVAIAMMAMLSTLVGCGKEEVKNNAVASVESVEENLEIEAETGSAIEAEVVEEESNTIDMTAEEYVRAVLGGQYVVSRGSAFFFAVQDVNNNEYEYCNIYSIQLGEEPYSYEEYENGAVNTLNVVDIRNCVGMEYDGNLDTSVNLPHMTYADGEAMGSVQKISQLAIRSAYYASCDDTGYGDAYGFVNEGVSLDVRFEYNADIDAMVLKSAEGEDIAYFGQGEFVKIEDEKFIKFTTQLNEGEYVVYAWMSLNYDDYHLGSRNYNSKEINFVTNH